MRTKKCKCLVAGGLLIALAACDVTDSPHTVHLKGQIQGMADVVELRYDGAASMLGNNKSMRKNYISRWIKPANF